MLEARDELDLLAFGYVAGEMAPAEANAFESRLSDEQEARDAVCRAVGLTQLLVDAVPSSASQLAPAAAAPDSRVAAVSRARSGRILRTAQPLAWMAAGAIAALFAVNLFSPPAAGPTVAPRRAVVQPAADALVWARLASNQEGTAAELERWLDQPTPPGEDAEDGIAEPAVPSWVFAVNRGPGHGDKP